MRILIYSSVFYPSIGGIENHTLFLAKEFLKAGHQVKIVTEQVQNPDAGLPNIEVVHSSRKWSQVKLFFWAQVLYMPNITLKGVWLLFLNPFKKWVISHNDFHLRYSDGWKTKLKKFFIGRATENIAVSRSVAEFLSVKSIVIHNCYNDGVFRLYPEERRIYDFVFVGRLVSQKGCDMLIDACRKLQRPFTLSIVGDGAEMKRLRTKVESLGLDRQISFLGFLQGEVLARRLNQHRVMVVPSLDVEGFGIVALEGLACGCRMLVSDAGGLTEAVGSHGEIFPMGDVDALHLLLDKCLTQPEYEEMPNGRLSFLKNHSRQSVAEKYLAILG